jgi:hypothetical protein
MRKLKLIEPFHIVRARRIRRERLRRFALGMALIGLIVTLAACAGTGTGPAEAYMPGSDPRYPEKGLSLASFRGAVVVTFAPPNETAARCRALGAFGDAEACQQRRQGISNIWMSPPQGAKDVRSFAVWRHELLHCAHGDWHD